MFDINKIRADFPILSREIHGKPLIYFDNGASAQKPRQVIDAVSQSYAQEYANVHRGLHFLSNLATEKLEEVRVILKDFLGAEHDNEIIFNSGATEGINLVSYAWGVPNLRAGDEIILSTMEHHSNIVPWHFLRERHGVILKWVDVEPDGALPYQKIIDAITPKTKLIAVAHMSNILGTRVDIKSLCKEASAKNIRVMVDGSQAAVHQHINVQDLDCDFYVITGHKLYGPSGTGAVYIKRDRIAEMRPFMGGGNMINTVTKEEVIYNKSPHLFEAGTPGISETIGFGAAINYLNTVGMDEITKYEAHLTKYMNEQLDDLPWITQYGTTVDKGAIFSFNMDGGVHAHDISTIIDRQGVAIRAGHHCAQPLMQQLGINASARASLGLYNTKEEIDIFISSLKKCHEIFS